MWTGDSGRMGGMRKVGILISVVALLVVGLVMPAAAGPKGELEAAFHAGLNGGNAVVDHNAGAALMASPSWPYSGRILPFGDLTPGQEFCSDQPLGIWVFWVTDPFLTDLDAIQNFFTLDGEALENQRTPNKRVHPAQSGARWFAEGVPRLGILPVGTHFYEFSWTIHGSPDGTFTGTFDVVDC